MREIQNILTNALSLMKEPQRAICTRILEENIATFEQAYGSRSAHQAWPGGYLDHIVETMLFAFNLYALKSKLRDWPFSISDALFVLFLHDIEKPWKYDFTENGPVIKPGLKEKTDQKALRESILSRYGIELTEEQSNAMEYVEGEHDYVPGEKKMSPLAAFCHCCDIMSARIFPHHPEPKDRFCPSA